MQLDRRSFLRFSAFSAALTALGGPPASSENRNGIPYRTLGKTGERVSILCLGGSHIGRSALSDSESIRIIRTALDEGVNFLDNAHNYNRGRSEELMGRAMRDGYREKAFLMTKFYSFERDAESAKRHLEESLRRLQTDVIDLWQIHQILDAGHPAAVYDNKLPELMVKAREEGKVRYVGFTGHSRPEWHAAMLDGGFDWDTVQMPTNPFDHHWTSFEHTILPRALEKNIGVIGMKSLGGRAQFLQDSGSGPFTAKECLHYAMNLPISSVVCGMDSMEYLRQGIEAARSFRPLDEGTVAELLARCREQAQEGALENYKARSAE